MNERIKELKIQACKWASENAPMSEYENACDEKFAELIVRECAKIGDRHGGIKVRSAITKHFGVEE